jgi:DNA polymerase-3 subunit delta'
VRGLILHPETARQLESFIARPSHALLLSGPRGAGKRSLVMVLAAELLGIHSNITEHPYVHIISEPDSKSIGIEAIRKLEHFLSLKVPGENRTDRVVLIENSDKLTHEAQNALLKTLEEPPKGTVLLLTADSILSLLPTVRSRSQHIPVLTPSKEQLQKHISQYPNVEFNLAYSISGGLPGLMFELLADKDHPLRLAAKHAREILGKSVYERLLEVDSLAKDQVAARNLLFILQQMASIQLRALAGVPATRWQAVLAASYEAEASLLQNAQAKLVMTNLMLSL